MQSGVRTGVVPHPDPEAWNFMSVVQPDQVLRHSGLDGESHIYKRCSPQGRGIIVLMSVV
jgi:hypothetical protein